MLIIMNLVLLLHELRIAFYITVQVLMTATCIALCFCLMNKMLTFQKIECYIISSSHVLLPEILLNTFPCYFVFFSFLISYKFTFAGYPLSSNINIFFLLASIYIYISIYITQTGLRIGHGYVFDKGIVNCLQDFYVLGESFEAYIVIIMSRYGWFALDAW